MKARMEKYGRTIEIMIRMANKVSKLDAVALKQKGRLVSMLFWSSVTRATILPVGVTSNHHLKHSRAEFFSILCYIRAYVHTLPIFFKKKKL